MTGLVEKRAMSKEKFWNELFSSKDKSSYYQEHPSPEVVELAELLDRKSSILDLGCGLGKSALFLGEKGFEVTAVDFSRVAIEELKSESSRRGLDINIIRQDLSQFTFHQNYDLIIAHGSLHFLDRRCQTRLLTEMREHTNRGGYNIIAVFTDKISPPEDMIDTLGHLFKEGDLLNIYKRWQIIHWESYIKKDEHPNNIKHQHPINKIVARNTSLS